MTDTLQQADQKLDDLADRAAHSADQAIAATKRAANGALDRLQDGVDALHDASPGALGRAAAQVDELTRRGLERARAASSDARRQIDRAADRTTGYIQSEPVKAVLIAAAAGAALAAVVGLLARSRTDSRTDSRV